MYRPVASLLQHAARMKVTCGAGHMLSEKLQRAQNGTMFVDLD